MLEFRKDLVERSAYFESACRLKQFQFEINVRSEHLAQGAAMNSRSALNVFRDALACLLNVLEGDHLGQAIVAQAPSPVFAWAQAASPVFAWAQPRRGRAA